MLDVIRLALVGVAPGLRARKCAECAMTDCETTPNATVGYSLLRGGGVESPPNKCFKLPPTLSISEGVDFGFTLAMRRRVRI